MAIGDDFTLNAAGDIRADTPGATYTVLELHRWVSELAANQETAGGADDIMDITRDTPSKRFTDDIIQLLGVYNIDDAAAEWFYGGSIRQGANETETIYSGLEIVGSVVDTGTQVQVVRDKALIDGDAPFWGDQVSPFNGGGNTLCRFLVKSKAYGCELDQSQILVQIRNYFDTFATFSVTLGEGEATAAVSSVDDPQNDIAQATVTAYTHVTNVEGFQQIDIGDGNGNQPYYSKWTYGADTSGDQKKAIWEFVKDLTGTGTAKTIHGIDGELFRGITHTYVYQTLTGTFTEDEEVVWGTEITYNTLAGGTFTEGNYVRIGASGAAGRIMYDNGTVQMTVALEDTSITLVTADVITEYNPASGATGVTAAINVTIVDNDKQGGLGLLLASDTAGLKHHVQLRTGAAPSDAQEIRGLTSDADCAVNTTITPQTINPVFLGSYVGTLIGGFGLGIDSGDLTSSDTVIDLDGDVNTPPNNVTWTLSGVISGDRCLVGPKDTGDAFKFDQMTLTDPLDTGAEVAVVVNAIPANTPAAGTLRITLDDGRIRYQAYTSFTGTTFTIASSDYLDPDDSIGGDVNGVMVSYIDDVAAGVTIDFTTVYTSGPLDLRVRVRDGGATPIVTYEGNSQLTSTGGTAAASRIDDA